MEGHISFDEFWPVYVKAHRDPRSRALHFAGTSIALGCVAAGIVGKRRWLLLAGPALGYGLAFAGHWLFEDNHPLTFRHPLLSLRADLKMWAMTIAGSIDAEIERIVSEPPTNGVSVQNGRPEAGPPSDAPSGSAAPVH